MVWRRSSTVVLLAAVVSAVLLGGAAMMPFHSARIYEALPLDLRSFVSQPYLFLAHRGIDTGEPHWIVLLITCVAAGGLWGLLIALISGSPRAALLALVAALTFGPVTTFFVWSIPSLTLFTIDGPENVELARIAINMLVGVIAVTGLALGLALWRPRLAVALALGGSGAAVAAFLIADLALELLGVRVGEGNGAMPRVAAISFTAAAAAGGSMFAFLLARVAGRAGRPTASLRLAVGG